MAHETLAPWAETVPGAPYPMTVDELMALPDDGRRYELVEGRLVRMPPCGGGASTVSGVLVMHLNHYVILHKLGAVNVTDGEYVLSPPGQPPTALAPDAAFVRADRLPARGSPEWERPWQLAPDLAAEVASSNQYRPEMADKARLYLASGVRLVWIIWPKAQQVDVWRPGADQPVQTLGAGDTLDGLDVLAGFGPPVAELFA